MTHQEVRNFNQELGYLAGHLAENKCKNSVLNYAVSQNLKRFDKAVKAIEENINPDLIALEQKARDLGLAKNKEIEEKNKDLKEKLPLIENFTDTLKLLSEEEQKQHAELMIDFKKLMSAENEVQVYKVKFDAVSDAPIEIAYMPILEKMLFEN